MTEFKIGSGTSEDQLQQMFSYLFTQSSPGIAATGVLSGLAVSQTTTASASVLIDIGECVTQSSLTAGADVMLNNAQKTLDVLTANPMGATPRNDLVVFDPADSTIKLVPGTPNAIPTDPTPPTGSVSLARLRHAASAITVPTAKIDDLRVTVGLRNVETFGPWVTLPINTSGGWSAGSPAPQARLIPGGRVELRGALVGGASITRNDPIPMPAQFIPAASRHLPTVRTTSSVAGKAMAIGVFVDAAGAFTFGYTDPAGLPTSVGYPVVGTYSL